MISLRTIVTVVVLAMALTAGTTASADRYSGGGGHKGGSYSYQGGTYKGSYYRGGDRHGGHYYGRGYYGRGYYGGYYGSGVGVVIGWPWWWGSSWYYPYSYPYYPYYYPGYYVPQVTVPSSPPEYIERSRPEPSTTPSGVWYYCPDSNAYYPYVKECPSDWQTVPALPPEKPGR